MSKSASALVIPEIPIPIVQSRVNRLWRPDTAAHHLILAMNGAGKTRLITDTLLPLAERERVLILDVKGNDPSWAGVAREVRDIRPGFGTAREGGGPAGLWFRLVLDRANLVDARERCRAALDVVADEGHTVLVIDETRAVADDAELAARALVERIVLTGRSGNTSVILASQDTTWLPTSVRSQWAFGWVGALRDDAVRRDAARILGLPPREAVPTLRRVRKRQWLYVDEEDEGAIAIALS